jgi:hypothetical protein
MQIIFGKEVADQVRDRYTVLELETFDIAGKGPTTAYCVLDAAKVVIAEMPDLERLTMLHQAVVDGWNRKDFSTVAQGIEHIYGKFGGQLDSFYDELTNRMSLREQHLGQA